LLQLRWWLGSPAVHEFILECRRRDADEPVVEIASAAFSGLAMTDDRARTRKRLL
jgi:hypothetical protein